MLEVLASPLAFISSKASMHPFSQLNKKFPAPVGNQQWETKPNQHQHRGFQNGRPHCLKKQRDRRRQLDRRQEYKAAWRKDKRNPVIQVGHLFTHCPVTFSAECRRTKTNRVHAGFGWSLSESNVQTSSNSIHNNPFQEAWMSCMVLTSVGWSLSESRIQTTPSAASKALICSKEKEQRPRHVQCVKGCLK